MFASLNRKLMSLTALVSLVVGGLGAPAFADDSGVFDGTSTWIDIPVMPFYKQGNFTVEGMFKTSSPGAIFNLGTHNGPDTYFSVQIADYKDDKTTHKGVLRAIFRKLSGQGGNDIITTTSVTDGKWHHFAAVGNEGKVELYLDGTSVSPDAGNGIYLTDYIQVSKHKDPITIDATPDLAVALGRNVKSNTRYFKGEMDEIRFWSVPLSANQIKGIVDGISPIALVGHYSFDQEGLTADTKILKESTQSLPRTDYTGTINGTLTTGSGGLSLKDVKN